ncbi:MAG: thiamine ABC transporter substrate-binding protein, partial [Anaerolineaceae bacterium]
MKKNNAFGFILLLMVILLTACTSGNQTAAEPVALTVMTHDSYAVSEPIITAFETENNVKLVFHKSGDAGSALNRAILTKNNPQAVVYYGVDNALLSLALKEEIFETFT